MKLTISLLAITSLVLGLAVAARAQNPSEDKVTRALEEFEKGNAEKAIALLTESIKQRPDDADAYLLRSTFRSSSGDKPGAMADINKVIELKPDLGSAYYSRAMLRIANDDPAGALKDVDSAVVNHYQGDGVYDVRSMLRDQQGDKRGALSDLDEAIKLNPNNPGSYLRRADLSLSFKDTDRAFADLNYLLNWYENDPVMRPVPEQGRLVTKAGTAQSGTGAAGDKSKEKDSKSRGLVLFVATVNKSPADKEMTPTIANAYLKRGYINSTRGNSDAAIADFTRSIRLLPDDSQAYLYRVWELEDKGDLAGALTDVLKVIELEPRNGNARVEQGVLLMLLGKSKEAQVVFDGLLESDVVLWRKRIDERIASVKTKLPARKN